MELSSVSGSVAALNVQHSNNSAPANRQLQEAQTVGSISANQIPQQNKVDSTVNSKSAAQDKKAAVVSNESSKKKVREMSHVVQSYNLQGKVRVKFMDNNNNVIYQIPSEMVAKTEDLMLTPNTSADLKG